MFTFFSVQFICGAIGQRTKSTISSQEVRPVKLWNQIAIGSAIVAVCKRRNKNKSTPSLRA